MNDPELFFRNLCDATRLRSLLLMQSEGELCVCELTFALEMSQPKISRHLAILRDAGIVTDRRQGQWIYYRINSDLPEWATEVLDSALTGASRWKPHINDVKSLRSMPDRPEKICCA